MPPAPDLLWRRCRTDVAHKDSLSKTVTALRGGVDDAPALAPVAGPALVATTTRSRHLDKPTTARGTPPPLPTPPPPTAPSAPPVALPGAHTRTNGVADLSPHGDKKTPAVVAASTHAGRPCLALPPPWLPPRRIGGRTHTVWTSEPTRSAATGTRVFLRSHTCTTPLRSPASAMFASTPLLPCTHTVSRRQYSALKTAARYERTSNSTTQVRPDDIGGHTGWCGCR